MRAVLPPLFQRTADAWGEFKDDVSGGMCVSPASDANRLVTWRARVCARASWLG